MKRTTAGIVGMAVLLAAGSLQAKTLEDVLKEKGLITEEDYKAVEKEKSGSVTYKPGEGFNFTSADKKFSGSIGASDQIRYTFTDPDGVNNTATKKTGTTSRFELKRIKLYLNGYAYSPDLTYKLQMNLANINGGTTSNGGLLEETWMNYRLIDEVQFRFGQDKIQFGRQFITPSTALQFVDQSVVTSAFVPGYDTGLMIHGKLAGGIVNYNIAGYGGLGQNTFRSTNSDNSFAGRLTFNPLGDMKYSEGDLDNSQKPLLSIGGNYFRDTLNPTTGTSFTPETNNLTFAKSSGFYGVGNPLTPAGQKFSATEAVDFNIFGFDTAFKWRGFSAQGEYFHGRAKGQSSQNVLDAQGFYAQAGYFVIPQLVEVAARYAYLDPNRKVSNDLWIETTGAVSWYINKHNLKLQADYTNLHKQSRIASTSGPNATDDHQVRLQAQILF